MKRLAYFFTLTAVKIQITAAIMGCEFCLDILCLVRTRCPPGAENIFMIVDVDFDYGNKIMYTINNTLKATFYGDTQGTEEIPRENGTQSLVSLAVDRGTSDVYYSTSDCIFKYAPISNITTLVYSNPKQKFLDLWVHRGIVLFKIPAGLYYLLPGRPQHIRKVDGLSGSIEDVAFDSSGVAYISTSEKVYRIKKGAMTAAEFLTGHYLIAADKTADMYFSTKRRLYLLDRKTDQLKLVGVFVHYAHKFLFDTSNYIIMEDQGKLCSHYKPVPDRCKFDVSKDIPDIIKVYS